MIGGIREFHKYTTDDDRSVVNIGQFVWTDWRLFSPGDWFLTFRVCNNTKVPIMMKVSEVRHHHAGLGVAGHGTYCGHQLKHVSKYDPLVKQHEVSEIRN